MKKLKNLLQCNYIFYILLILSLLFAVIKLNEKVNYNYNEKSKYVIGYIKDYKLENKKITIYIKAKKSFIIQ